MGLESQCTLEAWQERSSTGRVFTRCRIVDDAPELPDGPYEIVFPGGSVRTRKTSGAWDLVFLAPDTHIDPAFWTPPIEN
jgi:hypothetical protein